jgi:hypothetical protein
MRELKSGKKNVNARKRGYVRSRRSSAVVPEKSHTRKLEIFHMDGKHVYQAIEDILVIGRAPII